MSYPLKYPAIVKHCLICGNPVPPNRHKICSKECEKIRRHNQLVEKMSKQEFTCVVCGKKFYGNSETPRKTCSNECKIELNKQLNRERYRKNNPNWKPKKPKVYVTKICECCGQEYVTARANSKYCSMDCAHEVRGSKTENPHPVTDTTKYLVHKWARLDKRKLSVERIAKLLGRPEKVIQAILDKPIPKSWENVARRYI